MLIICTPKKDASTPKTYSTLIFIKLVCTVPLHSHCNMHLSLISMYCVFVLYLSPNAITILQTVARRDAGHLPQAELEPGGARQAHQDRAVRLQADRGLQQQPQPQV